MVYADGANKLFLLRNNSCCLCLARPDKGHLFSCSGNVRAGEEVQKEKRMSPGPKGKMGQILWHNDRYSDYPAPFSPTPFEPLPAIRVVAPSLPAFFAMVATDLERGRYVFDPATGLLWNQEFRSAVPKILLDDLKKARGLPRKQSFVEEMGWDNPNLNEWLGREW